MLTSRGVDNRVRWAPGLRLDHILEARCDLYAATGEDSRLAVVASDATLTFRELDERANQMARALLDRGLGSGDRIAVLLNRSSDTYVALLAVLKINAAYVPLDTSFPQERIEFILRDAGVRAIITHAQLRDRLTDSTVQAFFVDELAAQIGKLARGRLTENERKPPADELCYVIYTSGTTGHPKGVVVEHASICNFVCVAAETYGYKSGDRVYQGMTIAFDFSVEELWVPLVAGATLVQAPPGIGLVGDELADFLRRNGVTAMCCVPTLLATIDGDLPDIRFLLVSGEACPQGLVGRWHNGRRVLLNAYGPTEATVTATFSRLHPDKAVTIGVPLPTYTIVILDELEEREVPNGTIGEIGIAGIGIAAGYLNRPDLTARKFIPDFLQLANNPSGRIYRTGDLGRIKPDGEVEYHGRIDTQVKIRGYRIELGEIESVLLEWPEVAQAVVTPWQVEGQPDELVAYCSLHQGVEHLSMPSLLTRLRERLPSYMVPSFLEVLPTIPMNIANKADRKRLPRPCSPRLMLADAAHVAPTTATELVLEKNLAGILNVEKVSIDAHFFNDLGGHSLLMARYCAAVRKVLAMPDISMREVYLHPTVRKLSSHIEHRSRQTADIAVTEQTEPHTPARRDFLLSGGLQLTYYLAAALLGLWSLHAASAWIYASDQSLLEVYWRIAFCLAALAIGWTGLAIAAKWLLVGTWKCGSFPIWSMRYLRFWIVKGLMRSSPVALLKGLPIYNVYLRALGARIAEGAVILSEAPVATDLFVVGRNTIIRSGTLMPGYLALDNTIHIGSIEIGDGAFVGSSSVLDIDTALGSGAQLGHSSALSRSQRVPDGLRVHGVPAAETNTNYCTLDGLHCSSARRWTYCAFAMAVPLFVAPLLIMPVHYALPTLFDHLDGRTIDAVSAIDHLVQIAPSAALITAGGYLGLLAVCLLIAAIVPTLAGRMLEEGRTYVLFGWHFWLQVQVGRFSNWPQFNVMFGDSSSITGYLKWVGYRLERIIQTGANFGLDQVHDNPYLTEFGTGTMVSDGLSAANMELSSTSFRLRRVRVGASSYLGNNIFLPAGARTGDNVLLATKVMVPIDGEVRENIGLLGSPCFEIPRVSRRDDVACSTLPEHERSIGLARKDRANSLTLLAFLARNWLIVYLASLILFASGIFYPSYGFAAVAGGAAVTIIVSASVFLGMEKLSLGFGTLESRTVGLYHPYFLFHERHWKFCSHPINSILSGTPFKPLVLRFLGVNIGRMSYIDGAKIHDRSLVTIGDYANLNPGSVVQCHSLEEGNFKSDLVTIGRGCTLGPGSFVHYGVTIGDGAVLGPNAFLMKGELVPAGEHWSGNPAQAIMPTASRSDHDEPSIEHQQAA